MNVRTIKNFVAIGYLGLGLYLLGSVAWLWVIATGNFDPVIKAAAEAKLDDHLILYCLCIVSGVLILQQVMDYFDGHGALFKALGE